MPLGLFHPDEVENYITKMWYGYFLKDCKAPQEVKEKYLKKVLSAYSEPHRAYHTQTHIAEMIYCLMSLCEDAKIKDPKAIMAAIIWHDIIYDTNKPDPENVKLSAEHAVVDLAELGFKPELYLRARDLINMTADHKVIDKTDTDAAYFIDIDMLPLAAEETVFYFNTLNIRREKQQYSDKQFNEGRLAFLTNLEYPIFITPHFQRYEADAKRNIENSIQEAKKTLAQIGAQGQTPPNCN